MNKGMNSFVFLVAMIAGFAGFLFGFDSSVIADIKDQVISQLSLTDWQWSQVVSVSLIGCVIGIPLSGLIADSLSRRFLLKLVALGFIFGTALCSLANNYSILIFGRFLIGICIGIASYIAPLFISEIAPPERRGTLVLINGLTITFGQAFAFLIGYFIHDYSANSWRYLFGIGAIPALILFVGMYFVPHSPRWILKKYGFEQALQALKRIRTVEYSVHLEMNEIQNNLKQSYHNYRLLFKGPVFAVLLVGITLGVFQQFSGINVIMFYGPVIFESAGFFPVKNAILATFCMGAMNFIFTVVTLIYIDKLGRRFLLLGGTLLAALSLCFVSFFFSHPLWGQKYWILISMSFYIIGYCVSVGSLFWVLISEIYPSQVRGLAMSIATVMQWAASFVVSISFLGIYESMGEVITFSLFGFVCFLAFLFVYYFVPETTGVSLEQIEDNLMSGKRIKNIGVSTDQNSKQFELLTD